MSPVQLEVLPMSRLAELDRPEIERSAKEAAQITVKPPNRGRVERYLNPPTATALPFKHALLRRETSGARTGIEFWCGAGENTFPFSRAYRQRRPNTSPLRSVCAKSRRRNQTASVKRRYL